MNINLFLHLVPTTLQRCNLCGPVHSTTPGVVVEEETLSFCLQKFRMLNSPMRGPHIGYNGIFMPHTGSPFHRKNDTITFLLNVNQQVCLYSDSDRVAGSKVLDGCK